MIMKSLLQRLLDSLPKYDLETSPAEASRQEERAPDALERLLSTLQVAVHPMAVCEAGPNSTLALPGLPHPLIHYVLKGSGVLQVEGSEAIVFEPHSFIVLPRGSAHTISASATDLDSRRSEQHVAMINHMLRISTGSGEPPEAILICGTLEASYGNTIGMFDLIDRPISMVLPPEDALRRAFEALLEELVDPRLGSRILTEALLKQCLVLLVRRVVPDPMRSSWLLGSMDPRLAKPVLALLEEPARNFTLDELAQASGMSRSVFAARFHSTFGTSPIDLLKRIRLHNAAELLERTELPIAMVAQSVGYESRTYFSRAFQAEFGVDPRSFRARRRGPPLQP
ncbi:AraC family transcriptional regulator [Cribrihabitans pelagius]|uniref:helix-turn-helix transcriptional regulator n=1 Tax=Cribrihabitans pelagius TaxID=1765746 RepID=UPI003B5BC62A